MTIFFSFSLQQNFQIDDYQVIDTFFYAKYSFNDKLGLEDDHKRVEGFKHFIASLNRCSKDAEQRTNFIANVAHENYEGMYYFIFKSH